MDQRLANSLIMTVNEKNFIENALLSDIRVDGRHPFDYRNLTIRFRSEDGSSEVKLGHTQVIGFVSAQLVQPYRDRPNEGTFAIYTEFSPMVDPSFEAVRPGETDIQLGRIIDRGLRESRAVDTESLCVVAEKLVWPIWIDLHVIDNRGGGGRGNLVDAANIAALVALSTFRRSECTFGEEDGQEVIVHPPDTDNVFPSLEDQGVRQLYPKGPDVDFKKELRSLNRELQLHILELEDVLIEQPSQIARRVEDISLIFKNLHHLLNLLRPHQARVTLIHIIELQIQRKKQAVEDIKRDPYSRVVDGDALKASLASRGLTEGEVKSILEAGATTVELRPHRLRVETATVALLATTMLWADSISGQQSDPC